MQDFSFFISFVVTTKQTLVRSGSCVKALLVGSAIPVLASNPIAFDSSATIVARRRSSVIRTITSFARIRASCTFHASTRTWIHSRLAGIIFTCLLSSASQAIVAVSGIIAAAINVLVEACIGFSITRVGGTGVEVIRAFTATGKVQVDRVGAGSDNAYI